MKNYKKLLALHKKHTELVRKMLEELRPCFEAEDPDGDLLIVDVFYQATDGYVVQFFDDHNAPLDKAIKIAEKAKSEGRLATCEELLNIAI